MELLIPVTHLTVIIAITMSPNRASPARRAPRPSAVVRQQRRRRRKSCRLSKAVTRMTID